MPSLNHSFMKFTYRMSEKPKWDFKICEQCLLQFYMDINSSLLIRNLQYMLALNMHDIQWISNTNILALRCFLLKARKSDSTDALTNINNIKDSNNSTKPRMMYDAWSDMRQMHWQFSYNLIKPDYFISENNIMKS